MRRKPDTGGASLLKPDDSRTHREKSRVETLQNVCIEYTVDEADGSLFILLAQFLYHLLPAPAVSPVCYCSMCHHYFLHLPFNAIIISLLGSDNTTLYCSTYLTLKDNDSHNKRAFVCPHKRQKFLGDI